MADVQQWLHLPSSARGGESRSVHVRAVGDEGEVAASQLTQWGTFGAISAGVGQDLPMAQLISGRGLIVFFLLFLIVFFFSFCCKPNVISLLLFDPNFRTLRRSMIAAVLVWCGANSTSIDVIVVVFLVVALSRWRIDDLLLLLAALNRLTDAGGSGTRRPGRPISYLAVGIARNLATEQTITNPSE